MKCILVAEDNEEDFLLLLRSFEKAALTHKLVHVCNGKIAWDYLLGQPPFSDRHRHPFPDLLLLDPRMPALDGFELLRLLKSHPELGGLPVVVLSSSLVEEYIHISLSLWTSTNTGTWPSAFTSAGLPKCPPLLEREGWPALRIAFDAGETPLGVACL